MRYFVTGGAGFIGSHLVDKLVNTGLVTVYDNLSSGKQEFIQHHLDREGFRFIQADLLERDRLAGAMKDSEVVFHLAANPKIRAGTQDTELDLKQGTIATYNVLEAMRLNGIKKIVFASTSAVYGETSGQPIPEDYGPLQPISLYGASKLASEGLITAFGHLFSMQAWVFRLANVVGTRATHGVIIDFIAKLKQNSAELEILGDGTQEKSYIHADDCVAGLLYGFKYANDTVNVFNLGNSDATSVTTIGHMLIKGMGLANVRLKYTGGNRGWPGDVPQVRLDTLRMEKLGWKPKYTSDEAIRQTIKNILERSD
ncbi:MAG TPA: NAD-dependent epimerase/dehydratase family protein [Dehalococcoidales bacterium]|nr:NAD-dependent epimerase/dehydratase family protein [Dehalococcoidales bacterium]